MVSGGAMRGVRVPDLNGSSEADTALDLTLSLSVGDSRGEKKVVPDQATPDTSTRIAKLKNPQLVRTPTYPSTGGKFNAMLGNGAPAFNLFHAKVKMEEAPDAGSSSGVLSEDSRIAQGSITLNDATDTNGSIITVNHLPCVVVRDSRHPDTQKIMGFIYQVSIAADVIIVCTCHWRGFSPAGFVQHAGLTNVENPLRQIVVLPP